MEHPPFHVPRLQPLFDQGMSWGRTDPVQDKLVTAVVKGSLDACIQDVAITSYGTVIQRRKDRCDGIVVTASRSEAVAVRLQFGFKSGLPGGLDHGLQDAVSEGPDADGSYFP